MNIYTELIRKCKVERMELMWKCGNAIDWVSWCDAMASTESAAIGDFSQTELRSCLLPSTRVYYCQAYRLIGRWTSHLVAEGHG